MKNSKSIIIGISLLVLAGAIAWPYLQFDKSEEGGRVSALDGRLSLDLPPGWKTVESLNPLANLKVGDPIADVYLIVVSEKKSEATESTLAGYSRAVRERLKASLKSSSERGPWNISVGSHRAMRYEIPGVSQDGMDLIYLHTVVETPEYFHQVVGWAEAPNYLRNQNKLRKVSDGLREDGR